eukprot:tig00000405_g498.t1
MASADVQRNGAADPFGHWPAMDAHFRPDAMFREFDDFHRRVMGTFFGGRDPFDGFFGGRGLLEFPRPSSFFGGGAGGQERDPFFSSWGFGNDDGFFSRPRLEGPRIEELDERGSARAPVSSAQPRVQEPGDPDYARPASAGAAANGASNPNGYSYRMSYRGVFGPGGARLEQAHEQDSTGRERKRERKGLGEQAREVAWERQADGQARTTENLHRIEQGQAERFEQDWRSAMQRENYPRLEGGPGAYPAQYPAQPAGYITGARGDRDGYSDMRDGRGGRGDRQRTERGGSDREDEGGFGSSVRRTLRRWFS